MRSLDLFATLFPLCVFSKLEEERCYYDRDKKASADIIPCYLNKDPTPRYESCCQRGSYCLTEGACWDPHTYTYYWYGCTDHRYKSPSCPHKCLLDREESHWVGLAACPRGGNGDPQKGMEYDYRCIHPQTCGNKCPEHARTPWPPLIERFPPELECRDIAPAKTKLQQVPILRRYYRLPTDEQEVLDYLKNRGPKAPGPPSSPPPPPSPSTIKTATPSNLAPSSSHSRPLSITTEPRISSANTPTSFDSYALLSSHSQSVTPLSHGTNASNATSSSASRSLTINPSTTVDGKTGGASETSSAAPQRPKKGSQAAIIGGATVGAISILVAVTVAVWKFRKRTDRQDQPDGPGEGLQISDPMPVGPSFDIGSEPTSAVTTVADLLASPQAKAERETVSPVSRQQAVSPLQFPMQPTSGVVVSSVYPSTVSPEERPGSGIPGDPGSYADFQADIYRSGSTASRAGPLGDTRSGNDCPQISPIDTGQDPRFISPDDYYGQGYPSRARANTYEKVIPTTSGVFSSVGYPSGAYVPDDDAETITDTREDPFGADPEAAMATQSSGPATHATELSASSSHEAKPAEVKRSGSILSNLPNPFLKKSS